METNVTENAGMTKRLVHSREKKGLGVRELLLIGILLAAGAVLKFFVGTVINFGMKPNFIIAMYCLIVLLIRPGLAEAAVIGLLSGAVCQFFPGQPYLNFASELAGAVAMCLLSRIVLPKKLDLTVKPAVATFFSTLVSGFTFIGIMYLLYYTRLGILTAPPAPLAIFLGIILGTALINSVIVQLLFLPLRLALKL